MSFEALRSLSDRAALFTALRQDQLAAALDTLGEHHWEADLAAGTLTFTSNTDPSRTLVAKAELIASIAPGPRSLMWGWALPQADPNGISARLREYGQQHDVAELTSPEVAFPADTGTDLQDWIRGFADDVAGTATEITGYSPSYTADVNGTRAVLIMEAPLEPLTVAAAVAALPRVLRERPLNDPRTAVWDLARLAGWQLNWADAAYSAATVVDATGSTTFRFDENARITGIDARLHTRP